MSKKVEDLLRKAQDISSELRDPLIKSHDAIAHHALHAAHAMSLGDKGKGAAKKHSFMMIRHALEEAKDMSEPYDIVDSMQQNLAHHRSMASRKIGWRESDRESAKKKFGDSGEYCPHPADKNIEEDYASEAKPDHDKKKKKYALKKALRLPG